MKILIPFILLIIYETCIWQYRLHLKSKYYKMAKDRAAELGKPLMVIGDPSGGFTDIVFGIRSYGFGDVTLDLKVSPDCPNPVEGDIQVTLPKFSDNSHVIFSSWTFEYVSDLATLIPHIYRVSGGSNNIFVASGNPYSIFSWIEPGNFLVDHPTAPNIITSAPPTCDFITFIKK